MTANETRAEWHEIRFGGPDEPYLFVAGLRRHMGDDALSRAMVVPSDDGPAVLIDGSCLEHDTVRWLLHVLQGSVHEDGPAH